MASDDNDGVKREEFLALCKQVELLAAELEERDRMRDPEGPNGWNLRTATVIKNEIRAIIEEQTGETSEQPPSTKVGG